VKRGASELRKAKTEKQWSSPSTDDLNLRGRLAKVDGFHSAGKPSALAINSAPPVLPKR